MTSVRDVADRYFACMHGRDLDALLALFADHATMILPDGTEIHGVTVLREMYRGLFAMTPPAPAPVAFIVGLDGVAVEIKTSLPDGTTRLTANFFHLDSNGLIERLSVYKRGNW